jgi:two-component system response regulator DesR
MPLRIVLAQDRASTREGLTALLEWRGCVVAGAGADGRGAVSLRRKFRPDVAVLDFDIPSMNGPAVAAEIQRLAPKTSTVALGVRRGQARMVNALRAGVRA